MRSRGEVVIRIASRAVVRAPRKILALVRGVAASLRPDASLSSPALLEARFLVESRHGDAWLAIRTAPACLFATLQGWAFGMGDRSVRRSGTA